MIISLNPCTHTFVLLLFVKTLSDIDTMMCSQAPITDLFESELKTQVFNPRVYQRK